jgi:hypothetical protein
MMRGRCHKTRCGTVRINRALRGGLPDRCQPYCDVLTWLLRNIAIVLFYVATTRPQGLGVPLVSRIPLVYESMALRGQRWGDGMQFCQTLIRWFNLGRMKRRPLTYGFCQFVKRRHTHATYIARAAYNEVASRHENTPGRTR